jgi:NitT/TauT family transport system substrate-binding protein/sulfonate transport system substrate-binding protein
MPISRRLVLLGFARPSIIAQQQAIADTFFSLHIIPSHVDIRAAVWRAPDQHAALIP